MIAADKRVLIVSEQLDRISTGHKIAVNPHEGFDSDNRKRRCRIIEGLLNEAMDFFDPSLVCGCIGGRIGNPQWCRETSQS